MIKKVLIDTFFLAVAASWLAAFLLIVSAFVSP
jgi:hypothetical protein